MHTARTTDAHHPSEFAQQRHLRLSTATATTRRSCADCGAPNDVCSRTNHRLSVYAEPVAHCITPSRRSWNYCDRYFNGGSGTGGEPSESLFTVNDYNDIAPFAIEPTDLSLIHI